MKNFFLTWQWSHYILIGSAIPTPATGVYFIHIKTDAGVVAGKLTIIK